MSIDNKIYNDIAQRTQGDIYIGVVGPVRTGKSTFIKKFMECVVIPNIEGEYKKERAIDELPQSAAGRTIMTTEPKFIPDESVAIHVGDNQTLNVRMIDCVGYIVPSSLGYIENEQPRMVRTPWFEEEVPFNMAAELGTQKVISEHSTIGVVVTTDGSISDIPRDEYEMAEERVVNELKAIDKPFVVVLNCVDPKTKYAGELTAYLTAKYNVPVVALSCADLDENDILSVIKQVLSEFPVRQINVHMPKWVNDLEPTHWLKSSLYNCVKEMGQYIEKISQINPASMLLRENENIINSYVDNIDLGCGMANINVALNEDLFYKVLGEITGLDISSEAKLLPHMIELAQMKKQYDKIRGALEEVEATGYGIVMPSLDELTLEEPEIVKQGGRFGVKLKASAPSIHMMRADITTEVSPIVGSERQSEELVEYLLKEFEESPEKIWESNIFGKSLHALVNEGLHNKLYHMPTDSRMKLQETIERITNDGCNGLICIIL